MKNLITFFTTPFFKIKNGSLFLKTVLFAGFLFSALISVSANMPAATPENSGTEKIIRNYFKFPQILMPHSQPNLYESKKVEVLFTTDRFGNVNFALAKTDDQLLKKEVEKQFYKLKLPKVKTDVVHSVVLSFKAM